MEATCATYGCNQLDILLLTGHASTQKGRVHLSQQDLQVLLRGAVVLGRKWDPSVLRVSHLPTLCLQGGSGSQQQRAAAESMYQHRS